MKTKNMIMNSLFAAVLLSCLNSCNYLNVVPPEQADVKDMMVDNASTLNCLYGCYGYLQHGGTDPMNYGHIDGGGTDEVVMPQEWQGRGSSAQWNSITPSSINGDNGYPWVIWYRAIGDCNQFLKLIDEYNPPIDASLKQQYIAEANFLKAYYHFRALEMYGPIPIIDHFMSSNVTKDQLPGRSHFDYCVSYIDSLLDNAANVLPATYSNPDYFGRATSVICKALKARVLLLAASPLWNGSFPDTSWKNTDYETPGYGKELVSHVYNKDKWVAARQACVDAISAAESAGFKLFDIDASEQLRKNQGINLPQIPGIDPNTDNGQNFQERVMMLRYLVTARPDQGNKEIIWGMSNLSGDIRMASIPHYVLKNDNNTLVGGWGGLSPTLYTVEHFYTKNGEIPEEDNSFTDQSLWFKSADLSNSNIINLNVNREPRYYAWISFDGDEYSTFINAGKSLIISARDPQTQGYNPTLWGTRNYSVTGFLNKKWVHPMCDYNGNGWGNNFLSVSYPSALIKLSELYLNLAECDATLGGQYRDEAYTYLNKIRERAGVPDLTPADVSTSGKSLVQHVLEERFIELYQEGHRYYDIRRYVKGSEYLSSNCYQGLNAMIVGPIFQVFNTPTHINQPFSWDNRLYLMPISNKEIYANPQMVQAPGY